VGGVVQGKLASRNENKLRELTRVLEGWDLGLLDVHDYPPEDGATYYDNARGKALHGRPFGGDAWVLGEDSGIEVEGLAGAPGVRSARFAAGRPVERLLSELERIDGDGRRARYVCELVALAPDGRELRGTGVLEGRIGDAPRGDEGFGFDPIFVPEGEERTVAELGNEWKAENSHRARAARDLRRAFPAASAD
jgi:XTP/dITP diphosphohydrolase